MSTNDFEWRMTRGSESGYLVINEISGIWTVGWSSETSRIITDMWYQGDNKDTAFSVFREKVAERLKEGYKAK
ncbi:MULTISPECIES: hypothetical protein [Paenibacillus]|uniref:WGR domain-containing protein n=1 Tax=Paenibacillus odorifer TaxID=189426 RepID=A0AB36J5F5_9BACL|nr:hypothetical protein [Paenibacillus odorifer]OMD10612.1 hypothetical protein BJP50_28265 [Paenibacillus odorifer]OME07438.1 hypothetical protein BSK60_31440 [Paenibacillus odorifer]OME10273.1 hypothetical protein BSK47_31120 [Paenibacillus odorifer]